MFEKIASKPFWVHLLIVITLSVTIFFTVLQLLGTITHHGEYLKIPSVLGKNTKDAIKMLEEKGFDVTIVDSVYTDTATKGVVLKQLPEPNSTVKINRTVLLTVNRVTLPLMDMPALEGKSLNFALDILKRSHLVLGDTIYKPDFMRGSVLEQRFRGDKIEPGAKIPWGSAVDLVIGRGLSEDPVPVPDFTGMTFQMVKDSLDHMGVLLGAVVPDPDVVDTAMSFVWRQAPPQLNDQKETVFIKPGQLMDLWLSSKPKFLSDTLKKTP